MTKSHFDMEESPTDYEPEERFGKLMLKAVNAGLSRLQDGEPLLPMLIMPVGDDYDVVILAGLSLNQAYEQAVTRLAKTDEVDAYAFAFPATLQARGWDRAVDVVAVEGSTRGAEHGYRLIGVPQDADGEAAALYEGHAPSMFRAAESLPFSLPAPEPDAESKEPNPSLAGRRPVPAFLQPPPKPEWKPEDEPVVPRPKFYVFDGFFSRFGSKKRMQILASTVVGASIGAIAFGRAGFPAQQALSFILGGAAIGLTGGAILAISEGRTEPGAAKSKSLWPVVIGLALSLIVALIFCWYAPALFGK